MGKNESEFESLFESLSPSEQRILLQAPRFALENGNFSKYYSLLTDYKFMNTKLIHDEFGIHELIHDYHLIEGLDNSLTSEQLKTLQDIKSILVNNMDLLRNSLDELSSLLEGYLNIK